MTAPPLPRNSTAEPLGVLGASDFAFQPIVGMTTLRTHGFESLIRLPDGAPDIWTLLDECDVRGELLKAERLLMRRSMSKFATFEGAGASRLFLNIDNRVFDHEELSPDRLVRFGATLGLSPANVCIEINERQPPRSVERLSRTVADFLRHRVRFAIDDFGQGVAGLDTLMRVEPHYVKIDRAFIDGVARDARKRTMVSQMAALAHSLGLIVVAEGIEQEADFVCARALGCDLAQGFLIARPQIALADLRMSYDTVEIKPDDRRSDGPVRALVEQVRPLRVSDTLHQAVARFRKGKHRDFLPVVDDHGYVHGVLLEQTIRTYLFGRFGEALLLNQGLAIKVEGAIVRYPVCEVDTTPEALVDSYVVSGFNAGLVVTEDGRYLGVLPNSALLRLAADREVARARDQSPLTGLPGNTSINGHLAQELAGHSERTVVFFDMDNFKSFNDAQGFAAGDRVLLMFADRLSQLAARLDGFAGHVGGDDFVLSAPCPTDICRPLVDELARQFAADAESLYSSEDRCNGGVWARDRQGRRRFLPLIRVSAAILELPAERSHLSVNDVVAALAEGKALAKASAEGVVVLSLEPEPDERPGDWTPDTAAAA